MPSYSEPTTIKTIIADHERRIKLLETSPRSSASGTSGLARIPTRMTLAPVLATRGLTVVTPPDPGVTLVAKDQQQRLVYNETTWVMVRDPYDIGQVGPIINASGSADNAHSFTIYATNSDWYFLTLGVDLSVSSNTDVMPIDMEIAGPGLTVRQTVLMYKGESITQFEVGAIYLSNELATTVDVSILDAQAVLFSCTMQLRVMLVRS